MVNKTQEALKMAIEVMEEGFGTLECEGMLPHRYQEAIQSCKEALEQPAQEPFAWTERVFLDNCKVLDDDSIIHLPCANSKDDDFDTPLYTHPAPSWQGLDIDDRNKIFNKFGVYAVPANFELFRAIEQALKEKNT